MEDEPLYSDVIIDHYTGCETAPYCKPVVSPDLWHGVLYALLLCIPFWATLIGIVWLANTLIGGG